MIYMKKLLLLGALIMGSVLVNNASAQIGAEINIGAQPQWGPSGYDYAEYYYLPDIEAYYCIPTRQFTYFDGYQWITSPYLPDWCSNYDLYSGYKVVINESTPWFHFNDHRVRYAPYRYRHDQLVIRDAGGRGYYGAGRGYYGGNNARPYYNDRAVNQGWNNRERDNNYARRDNDYARDNAYNRNNGYTRDNGYARNNGNARDNGYARDNRTYENHVQENRVQENHVQENHARENPVREQHTRTENNVRQPQYREQRSDNNRGHDNTSNSHDRRG
jgi:hypothetical protein